MTTVKFPRRRALRWLGAAACLPLAVYAANIEFPGDSLYQFRPPLTDQHGQRFDLASARGQPLLMSMFYSSCQLECPVIFETIAKTLMALAPAERQHVKVLMITFDPARDTVEVLKRTAQAHNCDSQWTLARTDEANTRKISALLGVQYRRLSNGEFNHSTSIELLDPDGRIVARSDTLGSVDEALVQALRKELAGHG